MNIIEYQMRGGCHPDPRTEQMERQVAQFAIRSFNTNPRYARKGLKWTYNITHFNALHITRDPGVVQYLFDVRPYPSYIEVEATTHCNFKCKICEHTYWNEKPQHMPLDKFKYIINQFPELKWIGLTGIGQSFLNPDYMKMIDYCKQRGIFIEWYDNCYFLDSDRARHIVETGLERLFVSCDAATEATYNILRGGSNWERVMRNVKMVDAWKKRLHAYWPELCFHFVICRDNIHEAVQYLDMINDLRVDVGYVQYSRMLHNFHRENVFIEVSPEVQQAVVKRSQELGIPISWGAEVPAQKPPMNMCSLWTMPFIFVDGTVIPCCSLNEQNDRPWQRKTSLGNIFEQDFRKIWYGPKYTAMLDGLKEGKCPENCSRCALFEYRPGACRPTQAAAECPPSRSECAPGAQRIL